MHTTGIGAEVKLAKNDNVGDKQPTTIPPNQRQRVKIQRVMQEDSHVILWVVFRLEMAREASGRKDSS